MRFFILIALLGIAAARCPTGSRQCFNAMLNRMQQANIFNQMLTDDVYGDNVDIDDMDDTVQQQLQLQGLLNEEQLQGQCWGGVCPGDDIEDQDDLEYDDVYGQNPFTGGNNKWYRNQMDDEDIYNNDGYYNQGTEQCVVAQQQCQQQQQQCAQAQQRCALNPTQCGPANGQCQAAQQQCQQATQQCQIQNQQQNQPQTQCGKAQQQCANAQQRCANAQQKCANKKQQDIGGQQQCAQAQQQCANAQQKCANNQQQCTNEKRQVGQGQNCANKQQQCSIQQHRCANAQQQCANNKKQGNPNPQQCSQAQLKCHQAQQKCNQAQQQCPNQGDETEQKCGQAQQQCAKAQQKCNNAEQQCQYGQNDQQCAQAQKQCAQQQQKCAQQQQQCQQCEQCQQCQGGQCGQCLGGDCEQCLDGDCEQCQGGQCGQCQGGDCEQCQGGQCGQCQGGDCEQCLGGDCEQCQGGQCGLGGIFGQQTNQQCQPNYNLLQQLEQPNCQLAAKLYKQAKQQCDDKNTVVSPAAVQVALAALQKGAQGTTKAQIKRVQCNGMNTVQCQQAHAALIRAIKGTNNVQKTQKNGQPNQGPQRAKINCPTTIVVNQQTPAKQQFKQIVKNCLGGQVKQCPFKQAPQQCRHQINQLMAAKTNHKLQQIVPKDAVTDNTKMVAVNAMQLQAKWGQQFRQNQVTKVATFFPLGNQQPKQCQAIQSQGLFNYHENDQVQVVGIPTQQEELTLYVIVPKEQDGLTQVEKQQVQNGQQLKELLDNCDQQKKQVKVQLPKFQAKHKLDAKKTLQQQGVQDAFDNDQADFSNINTQQQVKQQPGKQIHLNKLIHQATIKITEQGITSANQGETTQDIQEQIQQQFVQQMQQGLVHDDEYDQQGQYGQYEQYNQYNNYINKVQGKQVVKANRAFAFAVKHNQSNQIVLVGRVVDGCQKQHQQNQQTLDGVDQE